MTLRYCLSLPGGERLFVRKRGSVKWVRMLYGKRLPCREVEHIRPARKLWFIRFWGPKPGDWKGRIVRRWSMWVPNDSLARQLAFLWDLKHRDNVSAFVRGEVYLRAGKKLYRPHSYERAPF